MDGNSDRVPLLFALPKSTWDKNDGLSLFALTFTCFYLLVYSPPRNLTLFLASARGINKCKSAWENGQKEGIGDA